MTKVIVATSAIVSMLALSPQTASADLKDGIIGGVVGGAVGALITNEITKERQKKKKSSTSTSTTTSYKSSTPSLNSQYSRSERVEIQNALNNRGYNVGSADGVLGKRSRAGIRSFQASLGEPQTGQLTASQFAALTGQQGFGSSQTAFSSQSAFDTQTAFADRPLQPNEVFLLQQSLWQTGFYAGNPDGTYNPATQVAMANFLISQNQNPAQTSKVQGVVLASAAAGLQVPQYLIDEANAQYAAAQSGNGNLFGTTGTQPGTTLAAQPQTGTSLFGTSTQQGVTQTGQTVGTQQQAPATTSLFGTATQPQQQVPQQQTTQDGFLATSTTGQAQTVTVSTQGTILPSSTTTTQQTGTASLFAAQPVSANGVALQQTTTDQNGTTLDIYSGSN